MPSSKAKHPILPVIYRHNLKTHSPKADNIICELPQRGFCFSDVFVCLGKFNTLGALGTGKLSTVLREAITKYSFALYKCACFSFIYQKKTKMLDSTVITPLKIIHHLTKIKLLLWRKKIKKTECCTHDLLKLHYS